jgi:exosortase
MKITYYLFIILFFIFFFAYYPVIYDLRDSVIGNELAHHAPLVIALSAFLVYLKRRVLREAFNNTTDSGNPVFFLMGLFFNLLGQASGVYYLSQLSIPLTIYGIAYYVKGGPFARHLIFPLLLLILAFPIPGKIYIEIVFPLKLMVTKASGALLTLMGYPVRVHGNIIEISSTVLGVVDACSGLNSLMAILTLSIFYSYLVIRKWQFRIIIVLSMLPLIMMANVVRVTVTALVAITWGSELAEGTLHSLWGIAVFIIAVLGLMAITKLFTLLEDRLSHD